MTDIGDITVRIKADASQLQQELSNATGKVQQSADSMSTAFNDVKSALGTLGVAFSIGSLVEFTRGALDSANNLYILSQRTGIAASTLSALNIPLKQNGSSVDEFSSAIKFLQRNIETANPAAVKAFDDIGLSVTRLKQLTPQEQFIAVANALGGIDDQGRLVADTLAIMGRGAQGLIPIIKDANGAMAEFIQTQDHLTDDDIKRVHDADDAWTDFWEHMKMHAVEATLSLKEFVATLGTLPNANGRGFFPEQSYHIEGFNDNLPERPKPPPISTYTSENYVPGGQVQNNGTAQFDTAGNVIQPSTDWNSSVNFNLNDKSAKGNNNDLKGNTPPPTNELKEYIENLNQEAIALGQSKQALELYKAEKEGASKALDDFNNHLRDSPKLSDDEKKAIDDATLSYVAHQKAIEDANKAQEKAIQVAAQLEAQISSSLASIVLNFKNLGQTVTQVMDQIAKKIIEDTITTPFVNSLGQMLGAPNTAKGGKQPSGSDAGSLFSGLRHLLGFASGDPSNSDDSGEFDDFMGFASGGSPPVGVPSLVGEEGPELFVPNSAGTIIPNGGFGGQSVMVQQNINLSPGMAETINAAIRNAAPAIASLAHASVMQAIQKGGADSKIVGLRSN